jgi:hypothetical protein
MTPTDTMQRYFATWHARDFDAFEAQLADDVDFAGPLGRATVRAGRIRRIRVTFDPRPLLA